jgi:hypothetical protein
MKIRREDLKHLRIAAAAGAIMAVLGVAAIAVADHYLTAATKLRNAAREQSAAAQERVSKVFEEEREIRESLVFYQTMQRQGMLGPENRLDWIDAIAKIKSERKLFEIKYNIEAQKLLDYPGVTATKSTDFFVSRMRLDMLLLHEEDLLNFLSDLRSVGRFHVSVRRCSVNRIERSAATQAQGLYPRLRSECQIDLITVRETKPT